MSADFILPSFPAFMILGSQSIHHEPGWRSKGSKVARSDGPRYAETMGALVEEGENRDSGRRLKQGGGGIFANSPQCLAKIVAAVLLVENRFERLHWMGRGSPILYL